ncbi:hypothetical protein CC85DRAFT_284191 [Cutaneotrichosporon oleaginosum]|uniref:Uncharacterized protein n=1 Tax=Cutaneotrichosporon oleaginosum TaxID=879819 RepID=A0A0J1B824_9TREE|nr:uncharacterized protein CC85DRAFT_284191 [Cutaneotrichosporon oleaginosum]KLT43914.1 hypothetical protein CC85DRAFT_284191 [Cutaneotrichosporon oleaginosum]TXT06348.1 hypothetical protein COLE_05679 [Cutaneotrichosporon oleaginosum]
MLTASSSCSPYLRSRTPAYPSDSTLSTSMNGKRCTSLEMLSPASPHFVDDALEFQLLHGPHACARGTIPAGMHLANMAWGLIRAFEVWDEYECLKAAGVDMEDYFDDDEYYQDEQYAECTKKTTPYHTYDFDSESDSTPSPASSPRLSQSPHSSYTTTYSYELRLDEAEHEWPAIFGPGEPVRSRWLLSFASTASLLQSKAFNLACHP